MAIGDVLSVTDNDSVIVQPRRFSITVTEQWQ